MTDRRAMATLSDEDLGRLLTSLGRELAVPSSTVTGSDAARLARLRIEADGIRPEVGLLGRLGVRARGGRLRVPARGGRPAPRPIRRSLLLAIIALLAIAAVAGAVGFGLPGLRIVFAPAGSTVPSGFPAPSASRSPSVAPSSSQPAVATPSATLGPPGFGLGLGERVSLAEAASRVDFAIRVPADPRLGPPDAIWIDAVDRISLVWLPRDGFPGIIDAGVALIVSEFPGHLDSGYFEKILRGGTTIETVRVDEARGYWISGTPHDFVYVNPSGEPTFDPRRIGDTLAWSTGEVTYRIEATLGRDGAIALAESMP